MSRNMKIIQAEINELTTKLNKLYDEMCKCNRTESQKKSDSYRKRKELLEKTSKIFQEILVPGDFVKVTGSRAGNHRKVVEIKCDILIGSTCSVTRTGEISRVNEYNIITCGTNKITAVLRNDKWITAKELMENNL